MESKKIFKKIIAVAVGLSIAISSTGLALGANPGKVIKKDFANFRGNMSHNAVTNSLIPNDPSKAALYWAKKSGFGFDQGAVGSPILVDGYLYYNQGKTINKMDAMSGEVVASGTMVDGSNFSIIPPTYGAGKIYVGLSNGRIQAFDAKTLKSLWLFQDPLKGQPNSPITYYKGYVYTGFWNSETRDANFVCVSAKDSDPKKTKEKKTAKWSYTSKGGFYWAGAYVCKNFVLVGTDDGEYGYDSKSSKLLAFDRKSGKILDKIEGLNADIRSNISYDKDTNRYYFTTKGGSFYSVKVSQEGKISDLKEIDLGGMSTSTPAIYNKRAYVGVSGRGQFSRYQGHNITVVDLKNWKVAYKADCMGYPQTSGLISTGYVDKDGYVYVYFFENMTPGKLRYIKDKPGQTSLIDGVEEKEQEGNKEVVYNCAPTLFTPQKGQAQYAICSPIADEYGTIYFKNDSAHMMALGSKIESIEVKKNPYQTTYDIGEKINLRGIKVVANLANGMTRDISQYITASETPLSGKETYTDIYYDDQMYNDEGTSDILYTSIDIKVNDEAVSKMNMAKKSAVKKLKPSVTLRKSGKKVYVKWKRLKGVDGYQVYRSYKKSKGYKRVKTLSSEKKVNLTQSKLKKGKRYYYKVRPYIVVNNVKVYGKWSKIKSIKR